MLFDLFDLRFQEFLKQFERVVKLLFSLEGIDGNLSVRIKPFS